jgi:hypothetical protein
MTDEMHYTNSNPAAWVKAMADMEIDPPAVTTNWHDGGLVTHSHRASVHVSESTMDDIDRLFFDLRKLKNDYAEACADADRVRMAEARKGEIAGEIERKILELQQAVRGVTP